MSTGNYDLQINWPNGRHSSAGTITDEQWAEVARVLSPDWQARAAQPAPAGVPSAEQLAEALSNVRCFHDMSAELIAPSLRANLAALLAQPATEAEEVEVVGYWREDGLHWTEESAAHGGRPYEPLMTVAKHSHIIAAHRVEVSSLRGSCKALGAENTQLKRQLKKLERARAALAAAGVTP